MGVNKIQPGMRFTKLTVIAYSHSEIQGRRWLCRCDCGKEVVVLGKGLNCGKHTSCGCRKGEWSIRHGMTGNKTYKAWQHMKARCIDPSDKGFKDYGARGISYCPEWESFDSFLADMGEAPTGLTLGRINNNGNYEPSNCRWESMVRQARNKRNTLMLKFGDRRQALGDWADEFRITPQSLWQQLKRGTRVADEVTRGA